MRRARGALLLHRHVALESERALLQLRDVPVALHLGGGGAEALGRGHRRVRAADGLELRLVTGVPEVAHVVGAQQRERMVARQVVPQLLELHGGVAMTVLPQEIDHLAVDAQAHARPRHHRLANDLADAVPEQRPVRHPAHHEGGEDLGGVVQAELARVAGRVDVDPQRLVALDEGLAVSLARDDDDRRPLTQRGGDEVRHEAGEEVLAVVELDRVRVVRQTGALGRELLHLGAAEQAHAARGLGRCGQAAFAREEPHHVSGQAENLRCIDSRQQVFGRRDGLRHSGLQESEEA